MNSRGTLTGVILDKMEDIDGENIYILVLDSYISLIDATDNIMVTAGKVSNHVDSMVDSLNSMSKKIDTSKISRDPFTNANNNVIDGFDTVYNQLSTLDKRISAMLTKVTNYDSDVHKTTEAIIISLKTTKAYMDTIGSIIRLDMTRVDNKFDKAIMNLEKLKNAGNSF